LRGWQKKKAPLVAEPFYANQFPFQAIEYDPFKD